MNFRTTLILIVVLAMAGVVVFLTRDSSSTDSAATNLAKTDSANSGAKVIDFDSSAIDRIKITPADDKALSISRHGAVWNLEEPVNAPADPAMMTRLLESLTGLRSKGTIGNGSPADVAATGLDHPRFKIELTDRNAQSIVLNVGERAATGGNLYVQKSGDKAITLVAADLYEQLDKPSTAYRRAKILDASAQSINQLTIASGAPTSQPASTLPLVLQKPANDWQIVEPSPMPAETSAVTDLLFVLTGIKAEEFVAESVDDPHRRRLDQPQLTVSFSLNKPATQPTTSATTQETPTTIKFGGYTDVTRKFVYATASDSPALFTVDASTLESFKKSPNDLRDRRIVAIDSAKISKISVTMDQAAATQPTTREASHSVLLIQRAVKSASTVPSTAASTSPSTQPTTAPTTAPASMPATRPASMWELVRTIAEPTPAVDATVAALLQQVNPLRVEKYVEPKRPTSQPSDAKMLTLKIETIAGGGASEAFEIVLTDPGHGEPVRGSYNGTTFEMDRALFDAAAADFTKPPQGATPAQGMPPGMPGSPE